MFDSTSRYNALETAKLERADGRIITYKRRRFLPSGETMQLLAEVVVAQGDRLDNLTARTLGVPEQFWQVCDANNAMHPEELLSQVGRVLRVPIPQVAGAPAMLPQTLPTPTAF